MVSWQALRASHKSAKEEIGSHTRLQDGYAFPRDAGVCAMTSVNFARWVFLVAFCTCTLPGLATAGFVDQWQDYDNGAATARNDFFVGQSFTVGAGTSIMTPGNSYPIEAVNLEVSELSGSHDLYVELYNLDANGFPTGTALAASAQTSPAGSDTWTTFELFVDPGAPEGERQLAALVAGEEYAFVVKGVDATGASVRYQDSDVYDGGSYVWSSGSGWTAEARDLRFQTIMTPEPGTLVGLLSMGAMGLVGYGWRKRRRRR